MSEEAGFLAALAARPHDDTTRLVFADWLEERGDPRALWVRDAELFVWATPALNDPLPALLKALGKQRDRWKVTSALRKLGGVALPGLIAAFRGANVEASAHAREVLKGFGPDAIDILPDLREQARSDDLTIRRAAIETLGYLGAAATSELPWLIEQLRTENIEVFKATVKTLKQFGPAAAPAVPALVEANARIGARWEEFEDWEHGMAIENAIAATGPAALQALDLLADGLLGWDWDRMEYTVSHLEKLGIDAIEAILKRIPNMESERQSVGTSLVWRLGEAAVPYLLKRLQSKDETERLSVLYVLCDWNVDDENPLPESLHPAVPILADIIRSADSYDFGLAFWALHSFGQAARPALAALRERVDSGLSSSDRGNAMDLIAKLDTQFDPKADLRARLMHKQVEVRLDAVNCLYHTGILTDDERGSCLELALGDTSAQVRAVAAGSLCSRESVIESRTPLVLRAGQDSAVEVRVALLSSLPEWESAPPPAIVDLVRSRLRDKSMKVRAAAITALGKIAAKDASHLPALLPFLKDRSPKIRTPAVEAVLRCKELNAAAWEGIAGLLENPDKAVLSGVLWRLRDHKVSSQLAPALVALLDHGDKDIVSLALTSLGQLIDPPAWVCESVRRRLPPTASRSDEDRQKTEQLLGVLSACGGLTPAEIPLILGLTEDDSYPHNAVEMLAKLGASAVPALLDRLRAGGAGRRNATWLLGQAGPEAIAALPELVAQLDDVDASLVRATLDTLGDIGPGAAAAARPIIAHLRDRHLSEYAIRCLVALGDAAVPHLTEITQIWRRDDCPSPGQFIELFCHLGQYTSAVVPVLREICRTHDGWCTKPAVQRLGELGPAAAEAVPELLRALSDANESCRVEAATALGKIGVVSEDVHDELRQKARHDAEPVRLAAQEALCRLGNARTI